MRNSFLAYLIACCAGWIQRQQAEAIEYLKTENRTLRQRLGGRCLIFTDTERRLLARKAIVLGRPRTQADIEELIVRMATENPGWGYPRIQGALSNLRLKVGRGTIRRVMLENGLEPTPNRRTSWAVFLKAHWRALVATDFLTVEICSWRGLVTHYILFVIEVATRRVAIAGMTTQPDEPWMLQMARNLLDVKSGILAEERMLIMDRDTKYSLRFRRMLACEGIVVIRLPPRSPNLNAYAERFVRSIKEECLSRIVPIGQGMTRRAFSEYVAHYHGERNRQDIGNQLIIRPAAEMPDVGRVTRRRRLGGTLNYYERLAA